MRSINEIWSSGYIPIIEGICFHDGTIQYIDLINYPEKKVCYKGYGQLDKVMYDKPDDVTAYDIYGSEQINSTILRYGVGSFEQDGYLASFIAETDQINWIFFSSSVGKLKIIKTFDINNILVKSEDMGVFRLVVSKDNSQVRLK